MRKLIETKHNIEILVQSKFWPQNLRNYKALVHKVINTSLYFIDPTMSLVEVSVVLADNDFIHQLNRKYRFQDKPTNVLSFPASRPGPIPHNPEQPYLLGDIILAFETILEEAVQQQKTLRDHTAHLIVHGILHLLGYDHETTEEAEEMESREVAILAQFDISNPYNDRIESAK
ncbi:MAG: rRNA maturation RNase YbeY [Alphaproteobacteria bacterium]|nr:rRNA maturation RNase YbeY [Alphaproteobacteria bacterium]